MHTNVKCLYIADPRLCKPTRPGQGLQWSYRIDCEIASLESYLSDMETAIIMMVERNPWQPLQRPEGSLLCAFRKLKLEHRSRSSAWSTRRLKVQVRCKHRGLLIESKHGW